MAPACLINDDGSLTPVTCEVLHAVSGVALSLLERARIRKASDNWLRAPWYGYHRGGAITVGSTIWFTRKWFAADGYGDGSVASTWKWLQHLAHEVGHLPQAERFGYSMIGKSRYVLAFTWQYGSRALTFRRSLHDGAPLEIEADLGRWVLLQLISSEPLSHPLVQAVHGGDITAVRAWLSAHHEELATARERYRTEKLR